MPYHLNSFRSVLATWQIKVCNSTYTHQWAGLNEISPNFAKILINPIALRRKAC
jgi:hypothetical protein